MSSESDSAFVRTFSIILVILALIGVTAFILASIVAGKSEDSQYSVEAVAERVAPVGKVNTSGEMVTVGGDAAGAMAAAPAGEAVADAGPVSEGERVYNSLCSSCHAMGIAGAPKFGDEAAWTDRIAKGEEKLVYNAINGYQGNAGYMPAKGGNPALSDEEVTAAVEYMIAAVTGTSDTAAEETAEAPMEEMTMEEAAPAAEAMMEEAPAMDAAADTGMDLAHGKSIYDQACWVCHTSGAAGAPKFGDASAWSDRIAKGMDTLYDHAIKGFMGNAGLMPPKGGRTDLSDDDVKAAVAYMVSESQ